MQARLNVTERKSRKLSNIQSVCGKVLTLHPQASSASSNGPPRLLVEKPNTIALVEDHVVWAAA